MTEQSEEPVEDEAAALAEDAEESDDEDTDEDEDESVPDESLVDLSTLPEAGQNTLNALLLMTNANLDKYTAAVDLISRSENHFKTITAQFETVEDVPEIEALQQEVKDAQEKIAQAKASIETLEKSVKEAKTKGVDILKQRSTESYDKEAVTKAKQEKKGLYDAVEAAVKTMNDVARLNGWIDEKQDTKTLLPKYDKPTQTRTVSATAGETKRPRVGAAYLDGVKTLMPVAGGKTSSSFTSLKNAMASVTESGKTPETTDLHEAWFKAAGTDDWTAIKEPVEFTWPGKNGSVLNIRIEPLPEKKQAAA